MRCLAPGARRDVFVLGAYSQVRPMRFRGVGRALLRSPGFGSRAVSSPRPLALRAHLAVSLPLSIRTPMIVEHHRRASSLERASSITTLGYPLVGVSRPNHSEGASTDGGVIAETVCVWQFRLPPGTFIDAMPDLVTAFPPERRYVPSGGPPTTRPARGVLAWRILCAGCAVSSRRYRTSPWAASRDARRDPAIDGPRRPRARHPFRLRPQPVGVHLRRDGRRASWTDSRRRSRSRSSGSICAPTRASTRGSVPPTSSRSCASGPAIPSPARGRAARASGSARWGSRAWATASSAVAAGRRSSARAESERLAARLAAGEVEPLFGPAQLHPTAGAVLLGVRPPLVAFNVDLRHGRRRGGPRDRRGREGARRRPARACRRSGCGSRAPAGRRSR